MSDVKIPKRFWDNVEKTATCWLWKNTSKWHPYGRILVDGKRWRPHRFLKFIVDPPADPGLFACHHCDVPACVRPEHIFWGTSDENIKDAAKKGRTWRPSLVLKKCRKGHDLSDDNVRLSTNHGYPSRKCLICETNQANRTPEKAKERKQKHWEKKKKLGLKYRESIGDRKTT